MSIASVRTSISSMSGFSEELEFHRRLLRMVVHNRLSFRFIESRTFKRFVTFFNPLVKIPTRQKLSNKVLVEYAEKLERERILELQKYNEPVTLMFDGWKNVRCQEVLGAVLLSPSNQIYIWGAEDISLESQRTPDVMRTMRAFLQRAEDQNIRIGTIVTDSASSFAAARRLMRRERRDIWVQSIQQSM
ncbi:11180_t:CDS:2 [Paraglomus brasilianum]|uniref:11180_t:CDS:1 n=1 Tax=Paraglomus brasilianum TaxID=144538 RepID=A0A9N9G3I2_9GLOM|nr:11180_t:CDS:2 [Paraglomus brasilianum]